MPTADERHRQPRQLSIRQLRSVFDCLKRTKNDVRLDARQRTPARTGYGEEERQRHAGEYREKLQR